MSVIPEEVRRRLESQYHPTQMLETLQEHPDISTLHEHTLTERPATPHAIAIRNRSLPKCPISPENLGDSYAMFIMHCNPIIPLDTDTTELKKIFGQPPRSDGKSFSTFTLYELIKKLELKEIKTWAQLAIELGVEPPALGKGQSAQKVQQYAVRLKRWMHAMHVDAFFEYLLGKPHTYWTQVPALSEKYSAIRDGVPPEEDLALRALLPETRPKRGRRKNEDRDDIDIDKSPLQRARVGSPTLSEDFLLARASIMSENGPNVPTPVTTNGEVPFLHGGVHFDERFTPWSAMENRPSQLGAFRWPPPDQTPTPLSAYPQSAITPTNRTQTWTDTNEPRSALTPKSSRARRRHGPAVSSAWPSNSSGKLRGRPPKDQSVTNGPFSTFPANPTSNSPNNVRENDDGTPRATPIVPNGDIPIFFPASEQAKPTSLDRSMSNGKRSRLQLQVPRRESGNVRLATPPLPPPVVFVSGEEDEGRDVHMREEDEDSVSTPQQQQQPKSPTSAQFHNQEIRFQNRVTTSSQPFGSGNGDVSISFNVEPSPSIEDKNLQSFESHFISRILMAEWIDAATGRPIQACNIEEALLLSKQVFKTLKAHAGTPEAFLMSITALMGSPLMQRLRIVRTGGMFGGGGTGFDFEIRWEMTFAGVGGEGRIRISRDRSFKGDEEDEDNDAAECDEKSWKKKFLELRQNNMKSEQARKELRDRVLDILVK